MRGKAIVRFFLELFGAMAVMLAGVGLGRFYHADQVAALIGVLGLWLMAAAMVRHFRAMPDEYFRRRLVNSIAISGGLTGLLALSWAMLAKPWHLPVLPFAAAIFVMAGLFAVVCIVWHIGDAILEIRPPRQK